MSVISQLSDLADPALTPRLVLKVGSSLLVDGAGARREWLTALVTEIAAAKARGQDVIVVSSGAIALGARRLGLEKGGRGSLADAQAAAAVGQIALSGLWAELLGAHGLTAAQLLLTLEDLEDRRRYLNATATLTRLLDAGAVPVINENDRSPPRKSVLATMIAWPPAQHRPRAPMRCCCSDIDGLYDRHPREPGAQLLPLVKGITPEIRAMASPVSGSGMGSGGMISKLQAVEIAEMAGIALVIGNGTVESPLRRIMEQGVGTLFLPRSRKPARKAWLGGRLRLKGSLTVDAGAVKALRGGASLLAAGITAVEGQFGRGDAVAIRDADGTVLAHGLVEYEAAECAALKGHQSADHAEILGYAPRPAVVHRDQLVMV
jgi:glutamate 5-kinase